MNETCLKNFLIGSLIFHVVIIIIGMMLSHSPTIRHTFVVLGVHSQKATKTLFKRFENPIPVQARGGIKKMPSIAVKKSTAAKEVKKSLPQENYAVKKASVAKSSQPAVQKKSVTIEQPKKKKEQDKAVKKSVAEKKVEEKKQAPPKKEKTQAKKQAEEKKQPEQKKKIPEKKKIQEQVHNTLKDRQEKKEIPQNSDKINNEANHQQSNVADQKMIEKGEVDDESFTVTFNDQEMVLYDHVIRREIGQRWQSPPGVPKGTECTVRFEVANGGLIKSAELTRRSQVLIFDLGALRAARTCTFARCLWGKIFQVDFRQ